MKNELSASKHLPSLLVAFTDFLMSGDNSGLQKEIAKMVADYYQSRDLIFTNVKKAGDIRKGLDAFRPLAATYGIKVPELPELRIADLSSPSSSPDSELHDDSGVITVSDVIDRYLESEVFTGLKFRTRQQYKTSLKRIRADLGPFEISDVEETAIRRIYNEWSNGGENNTMAHSLITIFRVLMYFAANVLKNQEAIRVVVLLRKVKFQPPPARASHVDPLTADHVDAVRKEARKSGLPSLALGQAFQWDLGLSQSEVIGLWVSLSDPGISTVTHSQQKWIEGLRWEQIDKNLRLHLDGKDGEREIDLNRAPMVMEELRRKADLPLGGMLKRDMLPASGPVIVYEGSQRPYTSSQYAKRWRECANRCGVPQDVRNKDSRYGGEPSPKTNQATARDRGPIGGLA